MSSRCKLNRTVLFLLSYVCAAARASAGDSALPAFGRDTVLVYRVQIQPDQFSSFVVRMAQFLPDRFLEWEDSTTQGTVFMTGGALANSRNFVTARFFEAGVDSNAKDNTTLWLSQRLYRELKGQKKARVMLDSISGMLNLIGDGQFSVEVNRRVTPLPVIKVMDNRSNERWFLDLEDNPLMVRHKVRAFDQTLTSITTDKPNSLRWIKGKKLSGPR